MQEILVKLFETRSGGVEVAPEVALDHWPVTVSPCPTTMRDKLHAFGNNAIMSLRLT